MLIEVDIPQVDLDEVLLKVKACGICGSDVAYYFGRSPLETSDGLGPLILGHEFAGEIVEMGRLAQENSNFKVGDRVMANPVRECNACKYCARAAINLCENKRVKGVSIDGAFAEYVTMPYTHIFLIPQGISYPEAALCEPLACGTMQSIRWRSAGDFVVILGLVDRIDANAADSGRSWKDAMVASWIMVSKKHWHWGVIRFQNR